MSAPVSPHAAPSVATAAGTRTLAGAPGTGGPRPDGPGAARPASGRISPRGRRIAAWTIIGVVLVAASLAVAALASRGDWVQRDALDAESAGPTGTRALVSVLRDQGVRVEIARDRGAAERALASAPATLVLGSTAPFSDDAVTTLADASADAVLIDPLSRDLRLLFDAETEGLGDGGAVAPSCALPDAERAGDIAPGAVFDGEADTDGTGTVGAGIVACYPSGGGSGLLVREDGGGRLVALDGSAVLTNEHLAENGNAGLALNLLGRHPLVVWYLPTLADSDLADTAPTLGELTPDWVTPAIVLLLSAGAAAALWRGRRFGPLVTENLPVTVRAAETTEGRARLYARARDTVHAADQLRIGALGRLAHDLGLGTTAAAGEIADAAAAATGADRGDVRALLITSLPATDRDLVALADRLNELETATQRAVRPERNPS